MVEVDGAAVGYTQYYDSDERGMDLVVLPESRGSGVGRRVVELIVDHVCVVRGWERFIVDPDAANVAGTRFWQRVGFEPEQRIDGAPDREPYWLMVWSGDTGSS